MDTPIGVCVKNYLANDAAPLVFDEATTSGAIRLLHRCDASDWIGTVTRNDVYEIAFRSTNASPDEPDVVIPKIEILYVCDPTVREAIGKSTKQPLCPAEPIPRQRDRHHIKNRTLWPLINGREVVFFRLLDEAVVRGLIVGFNRFEIRVSLKAGVPVTVMRHGIRDAHTKDGRCLLKRLREVAKITNKPTGSVQVQQ